MASKRVSGTLPNLVNGISQQAPALRLATQAEDQENYYSTIVEGLKDRPPSEHVARILDTLPDAVWTHIINRDKTERYIVVSDGADIRVFGFDGVERTVNFALRTETSLDAAATVSNGANFEVRTRTGDTTLEVTTTGISGDTVLVQESTTGLFAGEETTAATITTNTTTNVTITSGRFYRARLSAHSAGTITATLAWHDASYLKGITDPATELTAITVADFTFLANKNVTCAMLDTPVSPTRDPEALVNVLAGNYGKTYNIVINGGTAGTYTTPNGTTPADAPLVDTTYIATQLDASLVANGFNDGTTWVSTRYQNAIHIQRVDGGDFTIQVEDGFNGSAMKAAKSRVQRFADLPFFGPDGFIVEVIGDNTSAFDNYWVKLETTSAGAGPGVWRETIKPGIKLNIDGKTMPHTLVRESDGTFLFDKQTWDPRKCGDENISPEPSFIGHNIQEIYFHRNRLGFLSVESAIMSRNGSFFDFFRTTATTILDDDPIDVGASHVKVSLLRHAVPFQEDLMVLSDQTQFKLAGNEQLTPKTVSIKPLTEYVNDANVKPLALGTSVFFTAKRGDYEGMWEYTIDRVTGVPMSDEITSHVPSYIPSDVFRIAGTSNENVLVCLTNGDSTGIYVHKYYWSGNQKLQSAWQRWRLAGNPKILNAEFVETDMYIVVQRSDGVYLEKLRMQPNIFDEGLGFLVHLDQRVHTDDLAAPSYDAGTNLTTYTLPYAPPTDIVAVSAPGSAGTVAEEAVVDSVNAGAKTVKLKGDTTGNKYWFGSLYERRYRLSRIYLRQPSPNGGTQTVQTGRLQLRYLTLSYNKSAYFRVEVRPYGRADKFVYNVTGRVVGDGGNLLGTVPLISGKKVIPVMSRNDRVTIDIINDSWMPSAFVSVEWFGTHAPNVSEL